MIEATNGREAVDLYRSRSSEISICLIDLTMPVMNGIEALTQIRQTHPNAPVVIMTGYDEQKALKEVEGRSVGLLYKPFRALQLRESLSSQLNRS